MSEVLDITSVIDAPYSEGTPAHFPFDTIELVGTNFDTSQLGAVRRVTAQRLGELVTLSTNTLPHIGEDDMYAIQTTVSEFVTNAIRAGRSAQRVILGYNDSLVMKDPNTQQIIIGVEDDKADWLTDKGREEKSPKIIDLDELALIDAIQQLQEYGRGGIIVSAESAQQYYSIRYNEQGEKIGKIVWAVFDLPKGDEVPAHGHTHVGPSAEYEEVDRAA